MTKLLLLNGPPRSGKDAIVKELTQYIAFQHLKFAMPLKRAVAAFLDVPESVIEAGKDIRTSLLQYRDTITSENRDTPRRLLDVLSSALKQQYGNDIVGRIFWQHAKHSAASLIVASDAGFDYEVERVVANAAPYNCILIRLHRNGTAFVNDSRSYIRDGICRTWDITNDASIHSATMKVLRIAVREFALPLQREPNWVVE